RYHIMANHAVMWAWRRYGEVKYAERVPSEGPQEDEGRLASTSQNRAAGRALRAARRTMRLPDDQSDKPTGQAAFAERLSEVLGVPLSSPAVSNWENGRRSVPSAVLVAAAMAAGQSIDALFGEAGEPAVVEWANTLGLPARMGQLEAEIREA